MPPAWRKAVYVSPDLPQGAVDRDAYVVCVREQLHRALSNRDVFASPSHRWSNPRARLLDGPDWDAVEEDVLTGLSLDMPVPEHLAELVRGLDAGWKQLAELKEAGSAAKVSIEVQDDGRVKLNIAGLGALGEPKSLTWLRKRVETMRSLTRTKELRRRNLLAKGRRGRALVRLTRRNKPSVGKSGHDQCG